MMRDAVMKDERCWSEKEIRKTERDYGVHKGDNAWKRTIRRAENRNQ